MLADASARAWHACMTMVNSVLLGRNAMPMMPQVGAPLQTRAWPEARCVRWISGSPFAHDGHRLQGAGAAGHDRSYL